MIRSECISHLAASVPRLIRIDRNQALRVAELVIILAGRLGDPECIAQSFRAKGNALYGMNRNKAALEYHGRALQLFRLIGNTDQVARTLSSSTQPLILQGRYDQAFAAAREAREIFLEQGNLWRLSRLDLNLGNIFDRRDRPEEAIACYERAYRYLSDHVEDDPEAVAAVLHNIAVSCLRLNDFRKALAVYSQARDFAAERQMHDLVVQTDYNIASLHYLRGDYARAISMLRDAREASRANGDQYHFALCHLDLSEIYLELNLYGEASSAAEQAAQAFLKLGMHYERGKALANMAIGLGQQGHAARALELFLRARRILSKERNDVMASLIDLYRALVLVSEGRDRAAHRLCMKSLKCFQRYKFTSKAIVCRLLLARIQLRNNSLMRARQQCSAAAKSLLNLESPALTCQTYALMGTIEGCLGRERCSYDSFRRAHESIEHLRGRLHGEELKISFMKDRVNIYQALVALLLKRKHSETTLKEVFGYIEQAKSRSLVDVLFTPQSAAQAVPQKQDGHAARIDRLREELNWYFRKIETMQLRQASQRELAPLRSESRQRELELLRLSREYSATEHANYSAHTASSLSVEQTRQTLPADTIILEYFQLEERFIVFLLGPDLMKVVSLAESSQVTTLLEHLQFQLAKHNLGSAFIQASSDTLLRATRAHLQSLYRLLIEPIREWLNAEHLVIAPHGVLHSLPFHALFDGQQYLIDEFTVSYAPSASIYSAGHTRPAQNRNSSLVLGIPDDAVPFVRDEVTAVAKCLPQAELLLGPEATVESLRVKGHRSRFIHIATHGYFRQDNPMFSGIRLGDSYLSLYDLCQFRLPAELVTLSGCSTGLSVVAAGDELLGLVRGLIHAGAESSLLTLWDVQDHSTAQLMTLFYNHLFITRRKAKALQQAMQHLRAQYPHPYYWAPFILVGNA